MDNLKIPKLFPNFINENYYPNYSKMQKNKKVDWIIGAAMMMKANDLMSVDGLSEEYFMYTEDMDLCKKFAIKLEKKSLYLSDVSLIHLGGRSEVKNYSYKKSEKLINNKIIFLTKFYGLKSAALGLKVLYFSYIAKYFVSFCLKTINPNPQNITVYESMKHINKYIRLHQLPSPYEGSQDL
jgi:GT2 family glycosyltransferase